jgi:hypothetical protein
MQSGDAPTGWTIQIEEASTGVYQARAEDVRGRAVELKGTDPDALWAEIMRRIKQLGVRW